MPVLIASIKESRGLGVPLPERTLAGLLLAAGRAGAAGTVDASIGPAGAAETVAVTSVVGGGAATAGGASSDFS